MRADLPVISFLCAGLLAVFIPARRVRCSAPGLAIVSWLVGCNLVHGINSLVWAGNVDIHVPVWCDIGMILLLWGITKLLLGAAVGLPGACFSISRYLELVSSTRKMSMDAKSRRNRTLIEFGFCYVFPLIYMLMHFIVQDHRFDLVKDLGCSASIHPSTPGLTVMWLPPLIICAASFVLSGFAIHNLFRFTSAQFYSHLESRSSLTSSLFVRRLATALIATGVVSLVSLFSVFSTSDFQRWTSWSAVHAEIRIIDVVKTPDEIRSIQLSWWGVPTVSIVYILLSFAIGEEARDAARWIRRTFIKGPALALPTFDTKQVPGVSSKIISAPPRPTRPPTLELKSGWDDMLDSKSRERRSPTKGVKPPSPASSSVFSSAEDEAFMVSTISYLGSPPAQALGMFSPIASPPPVYSSPRTKAARDSPPPRSPSSEGTAGARRHAHDTMPSPLRVPEDAASAISSVFDDDDDDDASWPQPPALVLPSTARSRHAPRPRSSSPSASSLDGSAFGCPPYPLGTPPARRSQSQPFRGSAVRDVPALPKPRKTILGRPSMRSITGGPKKSGGDYAPGEVIYMTVVKETV